MRQLLKLSSFIKDGKLYRLKKKPLQSEMATKAGVNFQGKPIEFLLTDSYGQKITAANLYRPYFREDCLKCGSRQICDACRECGKCRGKTVTGWGVGRRGNLLKANNL